MYGKGYLNIFNTAMAIYGIWQQTFSPFDLFALRTINIRHLYAEFVFKACKMCMALGFSMFRVSHVSYHLKVSTEVCVHMP